jgi:hypothetical protein
MTEPALAQNVRGKGRHYQTPGGELVPSVTNVIGILDKPALPRWSAKMVAETAYRMRHALSEMGESEAVDMLKGSPWSKSKRAADRGTDIHGYLEARLNGWEVDDLSPDAEPYRAAADAWFETADVDVVATELTAFHPAYAGTMDLGLPYRRQADHRRLQNVEGYLRRGCVAACRTVGLLHGRAWRSGAVARLERVSCGAGRPPRRPYR